MMQYLPLVFFPAIAAGMIQSTVGFGSGVFMMLVLPTFLPLLKASALSSLVGFSTSLALAITFRKKLEPKLFLLPVCSYCVFSFLAIRSSRYIDVGNLKVVFGLFLILLAVYFLFFDHKVKIKGGLLSALVCGGLAGVTGGLFGIGGPPIAIYLLAVTHDDKTRYVANAQGFFTLSAGFSSIVRVTSGILTPDLLPLFPPALVGILIGKSVGTRILDRVPIDVLKKMIYIFLAFSGAITFINNL